MGFNGATTIASVQQRIATRGVGGTQMGLNELNTYLGAIGVSGGPDAPVVNTLAYSNGVLSGTLTVGGNALTNQQYEALYEMLF